MAGGGDLFYLKFWVSRPRWSEIAYFEPIFGRSPSAETPSEKNSINTIRKSITRFAMSLRLSSYIAPQKRKTAVFGLNRTSLEESVLQSFFV